MSSRLYPAEGVGNGGIAPEKSPLPALRIRQLPEKTEAKMVAEGEALKTDHISSYVKN
ncbi:hypothetical protein KKC74_01325 [bacterium]|nr:hypothetical protein [bacterium]